MTNMDDLIQEMWRITRDTLRKHGEIPNPILVFFDTKLKKIDMFEANVDREMTRMMVKTMVRRFGYDTVCMVSEASYRQLPKSMCTLDADVFVQSDEYRAIQPTDVVVIRIVTATEQRTQVKRVVRDRKGRASISDSHVSMDVSVFHDANLDGVFGTDTQH